MSVAFVLGNGVSRKSIDLSLLKPFGKIYGCNALYRDFVPDVLVATDKPISERIQTEGYSQSHVFYTRRPIVNHGAMQVPREYYGFSSGPIAAALACLDGAQTIYLIGFDMGPVNNHFNNVYADTEFYKRSSAVPTYTGNWARQLTQVIKEYPKTVFWRVSGPSTAPVQEFAKIKNYQILALHEFLNRINNAKDL